MTTRQISVFLEAQPGAMADFCRVLKEHGIDMRAMCLVNAQEFRILRIIVEDVERTMAVLKAANYIVQLDEVLTAEIIDEPGALVTILDVIRGAGLELEYSYASLSRKRGTAYFIMKTNDDAKAYDTLKAAGIELYSESDLGRLFAEEA